MIGERSTCYIDGVGRRKCRVEQIVGPSMNRVLEKHYGPLVADDECIQQAIGDGEYVPVVEGEELLPNLDELFAQWDA
jgi:hypothetical protein